MTLKLSKITGSDIVSILRLLLAIIIYPFVFVRYKNSWLICERENSAQDNAWIFYRWMKRTHGERKVYFVIKSQFIREHGLEDDNYIVKWGSIKHYLLYLSSSIFIKAMFITPRPQGRVCWYFEKITRKNPQVVFLRHGILKDGLEHHRYDVQHVRLFVCGAKPEYDYIKANAGYPDGFVQYLGLARFDDLLLKHSDGRFVLFIPTWRRYLASWENTKEENERLFVQSSFYVHVMSFLSNTEFIDYLESIGHKLKFCIHAEFRRFSHLFNGIDSRVDVVGEDESIHELLMSTSFLITDYSSVFFDVAYMHKPMLFYQFDYEEFRSKHFSEGYFSYERDAMGPVVKTENDVIECLKSFYDGREFVNKPEYIERCKRFFPIRDKNNCERIYQAICSIEK